ncbi:MAG: hypothetical protein JXA98_04900 [Methanosarcinaceae archaeon]|nr:hypothetical protein [Methanosarcinaceae archaeon]
MRYLSSIVILFVIFISLYSSGCVGTEPAEAVNTTVTDFLNAVSDGDYDNAFLMYIGEDFLAPGSIEFQFKRNGIVQNSINEITFKDQIITGNLAVVTAVCSITELNTMGREVGHSQKEVYFRLQETDLGWAITKVSFNEPIIVSEDDLIEIEMPSSPVDPIVNNAPILFIGAVLLCAIGLYLDKKEKKARAKPKNVIDFTNATPMQKESVAQYVRFVPSPQYAVGKSSTIDVWVKNFAQQSYDNFAVTGTFPTYLEVKDANLFFGKIAAGETVKQTWSVKPTTAGWISINEPTVVFEYMGTKYTCVLDPVWIQVQ